MLARTIPTFAALVLAAIASATSPVTAVVLSAMRYIADTSSSCSRLACTNPSSWRQPAERGPARLLVARLDRERRPSPVRPRAYVFESE